MPDPFIMSGGWVGPGGFVLGLLAVLAVGWYVRKSGRG